MVAAAAGAVEGEGVPVPRRGGGCTLSVAQVEWLCSSRSLPVHRRVSVEADSVAVGEMAAQSRTRDATARLQMRVRATAPARFARLRM